jgi:3',5'-cyclic AMP phosphodiesterase CpdA
MRLLQISDTHFGTEVSSVVAALSRLAVRLAPDVLVLSGDITQRARRAQFAAARQFVDSLAIPRVLCIPGNHDVPLFAFWHRLLHPWKHYSARFGADLEPEIVRDDLLLLGTNTTRAYRHKHGEVGATQIARVAHRLRAARPEQLRVVVVHQPMHVPKGDESNLLRNGRAAALAWASAGADLVLGGHIHLPYALPMSERYPNLERELWCVQAGTAVSARIRGGVPNSVNVIDYDASASPAACRVARFDHSGASGEFEPAAERRIALQRWPDERRLTRGRTGS